LRQRDRRRGEVLAVVAHELRNFLAPITAAVRVLHGREARGPAGDRCLEIVERQVQHMGRLINDLLDVTRAEHGKLRLCREPLDLAAVVARAAEAGRPLVEQQGQRLTLRLPDEPIPVEADATRLEQIVQNLLANAAKYGGGGEVGMTVERA